MRTPARPEALDTEDGWTLPHLVTQRRAIDGARRSLRLSLGGRPSLGPARYGGDRNARASRSSRPATRRRARLADGAGGVCGASVALLPGLRLGGWRGAAADRALVSALCGAVAGGCGRRGVRVLPASPWSRAVQSSIIAELFDFAVRPVAGVLGGAGGNLLCAGDAGGGVRGGAPPGVGRRLRVGRVVVDPSGGVHRPGRGHAAPRRSMGSRRARASELARAPHAVQRPWIDGPACGRAGPALCSAGGGLVGPRTPALNTMPYGRRR